MTKLRNLFEKKIHRQLKRARVNKVDDDGNVVASKVSFKYEPVKIPYVLARHYIPDFLIITKTGKVYVETKGYLRPEDKAKLVAVKRQNPHLDIRIVFYAPNDGNIRWATRNGFRYAIGKIPLDWLEGL